MSDREPPSLPFHWVEVGNLMLESASDDLVDPDQIRRSLKELREVRMAKMRSGVDVLDAGATGGGGVALTGVGSMELGEERGFVTGVVDGLRYVESHK
jgi:GINS complex subunit 2